jgi:hypothetical protein
MAVLVGGGRDILSTLVPQVWTMVARIDRGSQFGVMLIATRRYDINIAHWNNGRRVYVLTLDPILPPMSAGKQTILPILPLLNLTLLFTSVIVVP